MRSYPLPLILSLTVASTGCASTLTRTLPEHSGTKGPELHFEAVKGGVLIKLPPQAPSFSSRNAAKRWGWWGDLAIGGAVVASATTYRSYPDAALGGLLGGLLLLALDAVTEDLVLGPAEKRAKVNKISRNKLHEEQLNAAGSAAMLSFITLPVGAVMGLYHLVDPGPMPEQEPEAFEPSRLTLTATSPAGGHFNAPFTTTNGSNTLFIPFTKGKWGAKLDVQVFAGIRQVLWDTIELTPREMNAIAPRQTIPPQLATTQLTIDDAEKRGVIQAEQGGELVLTVTNSGGGSAENVVAKFKSKSQIPGLVIPANFLIGDLKVGERKTVRIPLGAKKNLPDARHTLEVTLEDSGGFDAKPVLMTFQTEALRLPELNVEQIGVDNRKNGIPERGEQLYVQALVRNRGQGKARSVMAKLLNPSPHIMNLDEGEVALGSIPPGGYAIATYSIFVKNNYPGPEKLPLKLHLSEEHPEATTEIPLAVALNQGGPRFAEVNVQALAAATTLNQAAPSLNVDVDQPIQSVRSPDPEAIAVVIGIERYSGQIPGVTYALRDATMAREYFQKLLGVLPENTLFLTNEQATKGAVETALEGKLPAMVTEGKSNVYVYYAGHGAPDPETKTPFLVPYDGDPSFPGKSCYPMDSFYSALKDLKAKSVTVMLDACFSGLSGRGAKSVALLADARPIFVTPTSSSLPPGLTVLAAASGDQLSSGYPQMQHGLFTYYLLKGLRGAASKGGRITVGDLHAYMKSEVPSRAKRMGRNQVPVLLGGGEGRTLLKD